MSKNLFITATEARSGKSAICLGVMEILLRNIERVGYFRPLINTNPSQEMDSNIELISAYYKLCIPPEEMYAYTNTEASNMLALRKHGQLLDGILNKYKELEQHYDFILCEGTDLEGSTASFEFDINAEIANNLGCPVLLVANAHNKYLQETIRPIEMSIESLNAKGCNLIGTIINRTDKEHTDELVSLLKSRVSAA